MARYREKDETDLAWNRIRRRITRALDTSIQDWREEVLNVLLAGAWEEYTKRLQSGQAITLEGKYTALVDAIVEELAKPVSVDELDH